MAIEFVRRLLGRSAPLPSEIRAATDDLTQLGKENPAIASAAELLREILQILFTERIESAAWTITDEQAKMNLDAGVPFLRLQSSSMFLGGFAKRWQQICDIVARQQANPDASAINDALQCGTLDPNMLTSAVLAGDTQAIHEKADDLGLNAGLMATVLRLTLFPVLSQMNTSMSSLREGKHWDRGYCPTCGSWPLLGEFRGLEQTRYLRCGLCAAEWEFPRLRCPFCSTTDHRQLGYFHVESESKYRATTCAVCRGYVKMVNSLGELSPPELLVADVATMHLDLVAAERGFESNPPIHDLRPA